MAKRMTSAEQDETDGSGEQGEEEEIHRKTQRRAVFRPESRWKAVSSSLVQCTRELAYMESKAEMGAARTLKLVGIERSKKRRPCVCASAFHELRDSPLAVDVRRRLSMAVPVL
ncbi:hypothetical protein MTO96_043556 [Rhipicephalus appendiculatus]